MLNVLGYLRHYCAVLNNPVFVGMNILKTIQRKAATTRFFWEITFLKYREILVNNSKFERRPWEVLAKEYIFSNVADTEPETLSKTFQEPIRYSVVSMISA